MNVLVTSHRHYSADKRMKRVLKLGTNDARRRLFTEHIAKITSNIISYILQLNACKFK